MGKKAHTEKGNESEKNKETKFETKEDGEEFHKIKKKAKIVSVDGEADEVKEASKEIHMEGDDMKQRKEKKKKHKDKNKDGVKAEIVSIDGEADEVKEASKEVHMEGDDMKQRKEKKKKHKDKNKDGVNKAEIVSIDGEADEVKEASKEIHMEGDDMKQRKEKKKKHKDKNKDGVNKAEIVSIDGEADEVKEASKEIHMEGDDMKQRKEKKKKHKDKNKDGVIKAEIVSIDGEADEVKEASKEIHMVEDDVKQRKEKKKKHKDKNKDEVNSVSSLNGYFEDNKMDDLVEGQRDTTKTNGEEGGAKINKKRKREKVGDIVVNNNMNNGEKLAKERNHSDGKIREEVKLELKEKSDKTLEDNKMSEVSEGQNNYECGDIAEMNNDEERGKNNRKKRKKEKLGADAVGGIENDGIERENSDERITKKSEVAHKEKMKKKKKYRENNSGAGLQDAVAEKPDNENVGIQDGRNVENEVNVGLIQSCITDVVNAEDQYKAKEAKSDKHCSKDKKNNVKGDKQVSDGRVCKGKKRTKSGVGMSDISENAALEGSSKRVTFADHVEVFSSSNSPSGGNDSEHVEVSSSSDSSGDEIDYQGDVLIQGKRFSLKEDKMILKAIDKYIYEHGLGDDGKDMILHCKKHPEVKGCWKEITAALTWRTHESVYHRARNLLERGEDRKWTAEEIELIQRFHEKHGPNWRMLADALDKHRIHVKDAFRRTKPPNLKKGHWSQEEYQNLFDLVNMDLRMRAFEERKSKHGMLRDAISWEAISEKLSTRNNSSCCVKWYSQLGSPMAAEGIWDDTDDYRLVDALSSLDATCMEDVEWDKLLEHRSGDLCRKRWNQMVKHIGEHGNKSFADQVEVLTKRYCLDVLEAREVYNSKPIVD